MSAEAIGYRPQELSTGSQRLPELKSPQNQFLSRLRTIGYSIDNGVRLIGDRLVKPSHKRALTSGVVGAVIFVNTILQPASAEEIISSESAAIQAFTLPQADHQEISQELSTFPEEGIFDIIIEMPEQVRAGDFHSTTDRKAKLTAASDTLAVGTEQLIKDYKEQTPDEIEPQSIRAIHDIRNAIIVSGLKYQITKFITTLEQKGKVASVHEIKRPTVDKDSYIINSTRDEDGCREFGPGSASYSMRNDRSDQTYNMPGLQGDGVTIAFFDSSMPLGSPFLQNFHNTGQIECLYMTRPYPCGADTPTSPHTEAIAQALFKRVPRIKLIIDQGGDPDLDEPNPDRKTHFDVLNNFADKGIDIYTNSSGRAPGADYDLWKHQWLSDKGIIVVQGAGNWGQPGLNTTDGLAGDSRIISAGYQNQIDYTIVDPTSSKGGDRYYPFTPTGVALGDTFMHRPGECYSGGQSSFTTPVLGAFVAMALGRNPSLPLSEIIDIFKRSARMITSEYPSPIPGFNYDTGWGVPDFDKGAKLMGGPLILDKTIYLPGIFYSATGTAKVEPKSAWNIDITAQEVIVARTPELIIPEKRTVLKPIQADTAYDVIFPSGEIYRSDDHWNSVGESVTSTIS